jgi:hypothetical protein
MSTMKTASAFFDSGSCSEDGSGRVSNREGSKGELKIEQASKQVPEPIYLYRILRIGLL